MSGKFCFRHGPGCVQTVTKSRGNVGWSDHRSIRISLDLNEKHLWSKGIVSSFLLLCQGIHCASCQHGATESESVHHFLPICLCDCARSSPQWCSGWSTTPHDMLNQWSRIFDPRCGIRGGRGLAHSVSRPWVPISSPLILRFWTLSVFELFSWLQKRFSPPTRPKRIRWQIPLEKPSLRRAAKTKYLNQLTSRSPMGQMCNRQGAVPIAGGLTLNNSHRVGIYCRFLHPQIKVSVKWYNQSSHHIQQT